MDYAKRRIEVVATDGKETRRLIWIKQGKDGSFYYGDCTTGSGFHISYHESGEWHFDKYEKLALEKTVNLKGARQLGGYIINRNLSEIDRSPNKFRESDVVYVDIRTFKTDYIRINLHLVEKGCFEALKSFPEIVNNPEISLFTFTNPWVAITVYRC